MDSQEAKRLVVKAGRELVGDGLIVRTWGNVSCRIDEDTFVVTPSGRDYLQIEEDEIVEVKIKNSSFRGGINPSSERRLHAAIYKLKPEVNFIVHTHQESASVISAMNLSGFQVHPEFTGELGSRVVCADYALPGTKSLCLNASRAAEKAEGKAIILKNHGAVCWGGDYAEAFQIAKELEIACDRFIEKKVGIISPEEMPDATSYEALINAMPDGYHYLLNQEPEVVKYAETGKALYPYVDDFAQMIGTKAAAKHAFDGLGIMKAFQRANAVIVSGGGILCRGKSIEDAEAASLLVTKNCKAYFGAVSIGKGTPVNRWDSFLMRRIYLKKYSKLKNVGKN